MKSKVIISSILLSTFLSTACAKTDSEPEASLTNDSDAISVESGKAVEAATPETAGPSYQFSDAMRIPVDGSSLESFERSLEGIKSKAGEDEYKTLTGAIEYLMVYDIGARHDRTKLAQRLDGLTGEQIVDRVKWDKKPSKTK